MKRQPKGTKDGGKFAPDTSGKTPPAAVAVTTRIAEPGTPPEMNSDVVESAHAAYRASVAEEVKAYATEHFVSVPDATWDEQGHAADEVQPTTGAWGRSSPAPIRNGYQYAPEGECSYCDAEYERGNSFFPPHRTERKPNCGGGSDFHHCTCSACF